MQAGEPLVTPDLFCIADLLFVLFGKNDCFC